MAERHVFVARERELKRLNGFLDVALAGQGQVCFVTGEAGSGKTALVTEFARRAQEQHKDLIVAVGQGDAQTGIGDPYLPFREVLGQLTGDVDAKLAQGAITQENAARLRKFLGLSCQTLVELGPELIGIFVPGAGLATRAAAFAAEKTGWLEKVEQLARRPREDTAPGGADVEQSHIFEQYTNVLKALAAQRPLMLVLDDLQWADAASIELLFRLGRRIGESRILIVGAYRPEEVALGRGGERHPLEKVLAEFKRYLGDIWVDLDQAEEPERRQFVDGFLDTESNRLGQGFRQALYQHTGGHPLFTIELFRDMQERGDIVQDDQGRLVDTPSLDWAEVPARVEGVIEERIGRLKKELREILSVASVEGQDFTAQVVGRVQEMGERQLLRELSQELEKRHRLVHARGEVQLGRERVLSRYEFAHALFQQYLYNDLSAGERRVLHREVGGVLEELYEGSTEQIAVQLARHFELAGIDDKATEYLLQVGDRARGLYAHQEAIEHYQRALALLKERGEYERAARTLMKLGLTYHNAFDFEQARQAYDEGFIFWQRVREVEPADVLSPAPHALRVAMERWVAMERVSTLDPGLAGDAGSLIVIAQLFSGLVADGPEMDVVPDVARGWEILEGDRKYIFHLRDDVHWSDGVQVTAGDFEYAWKRVLNPARSLSAAGLLYDLKGARAYHEGEIADPDTVGVRALNEISLVVELEAPTSYFLYLLTFSPTFPVPRHVVETHGEAWTEEGNIATNGPFTLVAWERGKSMILERNPDYHGRFGGNLQRVELTRLADPSARLQIYENDDLDIAYLMDFPPLEMDRARQRHPGEYVSGPWLYTLYMGFDVSRPPFDDPRVRRAFTLATDRETLADVVCRGYYFPATGGLVPPGMPGDSPGIGLPYDPEGARQLLAEAGYRHARGFPIVDSLTWYDLPVVLLCEYLQAQWLDTLGMEITWDHVEWGRFVDKLSKEVPHMWITGWGADYPDPDSFLRASEWRLNTGWQNEAYDELVEGARRVTDQAERMKMYQQADMILVKEAVILPLMYVRFHLLVKPWVRKYPMSPLRQDFWQDVIIEPH